MERESPIKSWMQRHSPIKGRNKPLPVPPRQVPKSPSKRPIAQISGNAGISVSEQQSRSKRRLASFFKSTDKISSATDDASGRGQIHQEAGGSSRSIASPNLKSLSAKVYSLEEQLREAREQLDEYASASRRVRQDNVRKNSNRNMHVKDRHSSAHNNTNYNNSKHFQANARLDGVVESLLLQHQQEQQQQIGRSSTGIKRSHSRPASADMSEAFEHYRRALDAYEEARDECANLYASEGEDESHSPDKLKRKRSQVRSSSWQAVQEYAAREAKLCQLKQKSDVHDASRASGTRRTASEGPTPAQSCKDYHDKTLPKCPPKAVSPTPRKKDDVMHVSHHRRSGSKTRNELPEQEHHTRTLNQKTNDTTAAACSPSRRYTSSPSKLLPVVEEFEWDDEVF